MNNRRKSVKRSGGLSTRRSKARAMVVTRSTGDSVGALVRVVAANVRAARELNGMTVGELARKARCTEAFVAAVENGQLEEPGFGNLEEIATALNLDVAKLFSR